MSCKASKKNCFHLNPLTASLLTQLIFVVANVLNSLKVTLLSAAQEYKPWFGNILGCSHEWMYYLFSTLSLSLVHSLLLWLAYILCTYFYGWVCVSSH